MSWRRQKPEREAEGVPAAAAVSAEREGGSVQKVINLGKTIQITGDLTGSEDLTIEGKLEGKIFLGEHRLTIGEDGHIKADVQAKEVLVAGNLVGNITAKDKVEIAPSGWMQGNISSPRVVLADGARFRGSIDMEPRSATRPDSASAAASEDDKSGGVGRASGERARAPAPPQTATV